jgi:hypothetical protein
MGLMLPAGERFAGEHRVRDPRFSTGLDGVQVGARYTTLAPRLEHCELHQGDFQGLVCGATGADGLFLYFEIRDDRIADCTPEQWSSCPALDVAAITEIALAPR